MAKYLAEVSQFSRDPRSFKVSLRLIFFLDEILKQVEAKYQYWRGLGSEEVALAVAASDCGECCLGLGLVGVGLRAD